MRTEEEIRQIRFIEVWDEAYSIYADPERSDSARFNDMQKFLSDQVRAGVLSAADKCTMAADIMQTAGL